MTAAYILCIQTMSGKLITAIQYSARTLNEAIGYAREDADLYNTDDHEEPARSITIKGFKGHSWPVYPVA